MTAAGAALRQAACAVAGRDSSVNDSRLISRRSRVAQSDACADQQTIRRPMQTAGETRPLRMRRR
ncbi:hypothetical protein WI41_12245 [Burkholderia latens]|uniref:Uncharacterized protein n=1 Tax=Burkholderia latens TaxID=488446 RepID=A0AAP1C604_9BURK|nr:hypothetical protein WI41_12245 [Burkholderia latens]